MQSKGQDKGQQKEQQVKNLLLFDDDFDSMKYLKAYLEDEFNWRVELTAEKGLLERLGRERFELILVDMMIYPKSLDSRGYEVQNVHFEGVNWRKTGLEFLRRLRKGEFSTGDGSGTPSDVPVIVLSAVADYIVEEALGEDTSLSKVNIVEKPFGLDEIIRQIRSIFTSTSASVSTLE